MQATLNDPSNTDAVVTVTGRCVSPADPFYDDLRFSFTVNVRPAMNGPEVSTTVTQFELPTTVTSASRPNPSSLPCDFTVLTLCSGGACAEGRNRYSVQSNAMQCRLCPNYAC